jgi:hypothetical protein
MKALRLLSLQVLSAAAQLDLFHSIASGDLWDGLFKLSDTEDVSDLFQAPTGRKDVVELVNKGIHEELKCCCDSSGEELCRMIDIAGVRAKGSLLGSSEGCGSLVGRHWHSYWREQVGTRCVVPASTGKRLREATHETATDDVTDLFDAPAGKKNVVEVKNRGRHEQWKCCCKSVGKESKCQMTDVTGLQTKWSLIGASDGCGSLVGRHWHSHWREQVGGRCVLPASRGKWLRELM